MTGLATGTRRRTRARAGLRLACCAAACWGLGRGTAHATGFTDIGQDIRAHQETSFELHGAMRVRAEGLYNLDLDRGLDPSGRPLFPVATSDPTSQWLSHADLRLRTDLAFYAPGAGVAVKVRLDALDNVGLGSLPEGTPAATSSQRSPDGALRIKRAYGEALTPVGVLVAGRTGSHWGLGMLANGGDCADCDSGDSADRVAFLTPLFGHIFALAYDFSASGPYAARRVATRTVDLDPADDARTVTFAMLRYRTDASLDRRRRADKWTIDYGAYVSHRWQDEDVPASYLPVAEPGPSSQVSMARGLRATALDGWLRVVGPAARIELELAAILGGIDQPSLIPGVLLPKPVETRQLGAALESELGAPEDRLGAGIDAGYASGDPAPGFGVYPDPAARAPQAGDLDGAQTIPPRDARVDNFRFHTDYRIDRILWREIVGTVTDALYVRPHMRVRLASADVGTLSASLAAVASFAMEERSAPGGQRPLGVEIDPTLVYQSRDGLSAALEHAVLFPLAGLDNPTLRLGARPAQLIRVRLVYAF